MTKIKICGLTTEDALAAAVEGGADFVGFVFFPKSPRNIAPEDCAELIEGLPETVTKVGLFVDPDDAFIDNVLSHVRLDMIQLHGSESPERCLALGQEYALPVMKAIGVAEQADLEKIPAYSESVDWLLLDAKPPKGADLPGGNALAFDWTILKDWKAPLPWMLAGGLTPDTVAEAITLCKPDAVDVSSGVEAERGVKDPGLVTAFLNAALGD